MSEQQIAEMVAQFLATNGATRCPAAFVAQSTGRVSEADREELATRPDPLPFRRAA